MWKIRVVFSVLVAICSNSYSSNMDAKALSSAVAKFSAKFINELDKTQSTVSSPLSCEFVLALLALGTTDKAHEELLTSLGIPDDDTIRSSFSGVSQKIKSVKGVTLNVANKVYIMDGGYDLQPELKADAVKVFDADFEKVDFSDSAVAAQRINSWVEAKTNDRIKDLITADSLDSFCRLVLVNALYFKGTWKKQFDVQNTMDRPFFLSASNTIQIPMMYKEDNYKYGVSEGLNAQLLEMPYIGDEASMVIVLPTEIEGLNDVLAKLADGYDLMGDLDKMFSTKVQVTIPKFKIETEIDLKSLLPKLGITAIFNKSNSGLTKILNADEPLYVSKAIQKAFIEVNEEGAEAAAATAMAIAALSCIIDGPPVPYFEADRPFLVVILVDGAPHFVATYRG